MVEVDSDSAAGHVINACDISKGRAGISMTAGNGLINVSNSNIHDNGIYGIEWTPSSLSASGTMNSNQFRQNGAGENDVHCSGVTVGATGTGNGDSQNGDGGLWPSCSGCMHCPFN